MNRDPTAICLFDDGERFALARYLADHEADTLALVNGGVISNTRSLGFTPIPDPLKVHQFMLLTSGNNATDPVRGDEREQLLKLDRKAREGFFGLLIAYRLFVWQKTIQSIYGEPYLNQVNAMNAKAEVQTIARTATSQMCSLYDIAADTPSKLPLTPQSSQK